MKRNAICFVLLSLIIVLSALSVFGALTESSPAENQLSRFDSEGQNKGESPLSSIGKESALQVNKDKTRVRINEAYGKLPLQFEINEGETDEKVKFFTRGSGYSMYFTPAEAVLVLSKLTEVEKKDSSHPEHLLKKKVEPKAMETVVVRMQMVGANPTLKIFGEDLLPGKSNYLIGKDPKQWHTDISNYKKVRYEEVYPGIDLVFYGNNQILEYDFVVKPGADPKAIQLSFNGIESYSIENGGDLVLHMTQGDVIQKKPVIYQEIKGQRVDVAGNYMFLADRVVFNLGQYDKTQTLVIDPVLSYSTYLGSSSFDFAQGIAVDGSGNAYVAGATNFSNFPTQNPLPGGGANAGDFDAFVAKLNASGNALVYSTYLGGSSTDQAQSLAVDGSGNVYVTGQTISSNFPTQNSLPGGGAYTGGTDGFVTKLNASGNALVYSTYLGGSSFDFPSGIAVDGSGAAYVTGQTISSNFPTQNPLPSGGANAGNFDGFVAKLNASGNALVYSTYLGGSSTDLARGIAVDGSGAAYVSGDTSSTDFPTQNPLPGGGANAGGTDAFVTKLNASGSALVYSTLLGGSSNDFGDGLAVDGSGAAYLAGNTSSTDFPTQNPLPAGGTYAGGDLDVFVTKLNAIGNTIIYSTYLGGNGLDQLLSSHAIAVDGFGAAYVTGRTLSSNFPTQNPLPGGGASAGGYDAFVTKLNASGSALVYSTYLGGSAHDQARGIAVDGSGAAYVSGQTPSSNFPTQNPLPGGGASAGNFDAFVSKIGSSGPTDLVAYYPFNGNAQDASGNMHHGMVHGATLTTDRFGNPDSAYMFRGIDIGIDDYIEVPNQDGAFDLVNSWTLIAWANPNENPPQEIGPIIWKIASPNTNEDTFALLWSPKPQNLLFGPKLERASDGMDFSVPSAMHQPGQWYCVAGIYDGNNLKIYVNGVLEGDSNIGPVIAHTGTEPLRIGSYSNSTHSAPGAFQGLIDEVRIYDRALSGAEIAMSCDVAALLQADAGEDQTVAEGVLVNLDGTGSTPDPNSLNFAWSQVAGPTVTLTGANTATLNFTAPDVPSNQTLTFELIVDDGTNFSVPDSVDIVVVDVNNPPVADAGPDQVVEASGPGGHLVTLNASGSYDPDDNTMTFTWTGPFPEGSGTVTGETVQVTLPLGTHTIDLLVDDGIGETDTDFLLVQVVDTTPPVITLGGTSPVTVEVGHAYTDAGATASDTVSGDLTGSLVTSGLPVNTSAPGTFSVTYNVSDAAGNAAVQVTRTVTVVNTPPVVTSVTLNPGTINENDTVTLNGTFVDPTIGDIHTVRINWGDGAPNTVITLVSGLRAFETTYPYPDDVPTTTPSDVNVIQVTVEDSAAGVGTNATNVTVNNVSPTVGAINSTIDPVEIETLINASAFFTDPGTLDTHTAEFDWGDTTTSAGTVNPGTREVTGDHTYGTPGVYTVTLTVTDDDTGSSQSLFQFIVVYDPDAGFVTGGGGIDSAAGAYTPNPSLTGQATFGFVSKYKQGTTIPIGQTEFQFKVADLNFHSSTYEWLVVAGAKAMFKGTGTINGTGNYGFLVFAIDEKLTPSQTTDLFRIQIWDKDSGDTVVYDNELGAADDADPTTVITKGSIVVHKK